MILRILIPTDHGVGQSHGLSMGVGQRGPGRPQFPGGDSVLSPRASDHTGVGLKMVEYVLASSPTGKDLDARMANLQLRVSVEKLSQMCQLE